MRAALLLVLAAACGSQPPNVHLRPFDAGVESGADAEAPLDAGPDADPDLGGPCLDDAQCDDKIDCTHDACDQTFKRCRNVPDHARCDDGTHCNGREVCVRGRGCGPGPVVTCSDDNACTIDRCVESTKSCARTPRDLDGDGDPDDHCSPRRDCDDLDPTVASTHSEVCGNNKDDDCDGIKDEADCVVPQGDVCASAVVLAPGTTKILGTAGANRDYPSSCSVTASPKDVVGTVTIPPGPNKDLEVWASSSVDVEIAIQTTCGQAGTERACGAGPGATSVRARARDLAPGTYAVVITTRGEASVDVSTELTDATTKATHESCATAIPLVPDVPTLVSIVDPARDHPSACSAVTGELAYSFTLAQAADVRVFASTVRGSGAPVLTLRDATCTELRCRVGTQLPLFARLPAGSYVVTVAATSPIDASVLLKIGPSTPPPADQSCATAPPVAVNKTMQLSLADHEDAIKDGCFAGGPAAAYALSLAVPSDVLVVGRFPFNEAGAVSLSRPGCQPVDRLACGISFTPARASSRNVPAGDYRVVITDQLGESVSLTTLVRPALAPTTVTGADACASVIDVPPAGGFFTGTTLGKTGDFDNGCDAPGGAAGGAPDQILRLTLTQTKRVVLDMIGSTYATILDVRRGSACPGQPVACYVGFTAQKSFLDLVLAPDVYHVIVDGYAGDKGDWNLDVRVVDP